MGLAIPANGWCEIPKLLQKTKSEYPDAAAQYIKDKDGDFRTRSFSRLYQEVLAVAAGLQALGVSRGDHVGMPQELQYILGFSGCELVIVENTVQLAKLAGLLSELPAAKTVVVLDEDSDETELSQEALSALRKLTFRRYEEVIEEGRGILGRAGPGAIEDENAAGSPDDVATIIFRRRVQAIR